MTAEWIAAYLDGGLTPQEREQLQQHLLICADCRQDLAEASDLTAGDRRRWLVSAGVPAAVAAAAVLVLWLGTMDPGPATVSQPVLRGPDTSVQLDVVTPVEGAAVPADSLSFTWRAAGPAASYVFTLTDEHGDVLYTVNQTDTTLVLPRSVGLEEGAQYYWLVDALLDGARSTSSGFQGFSVR